MKEKVGKIKNFSIFDPSIRLEHKEFYEQVVNEINCLLPVCYQCKVMTVEITKDSVEQAQLFDLVKRVENFSRELLIGTKKLFDQYYIAKEELHESILYMTAYNKINTLDRNLLERTCDVRWWALETAFSDCIMYYEKTKLEAASVLKKLTEIKNEAAKKIEEENSNLSTNKNFSEINDTIDAFFPFSKLLKESALNNFIKQFSILFKTLSVSETIKNEFNEFIANLIVLNEKIQFACYRLEDINSSYTLYRDLLITDKEGFVVANSNKKRCSAVLGLDVSHEVWFKKALETSNGTEYFAQDMSQSLVEEDHLSLVYSTAVRENSQENGNVVGAMGVYFDFQGESQIILKENMPVDKQGFIHDGYYSMYTNRDYKIIASTDEDILEVADNAHIPKTNRTLFEGEQANKYIVFEGIESAIFSTCTDGYLDYQGLGWTSHVIIPKFHIFGNSITKDDFEINPEKLLNSTIIPNINKETYTRVMRDKESIKMISLNGMIYASKLGQRGLSLNPIFNQITTSSDFVISRMEELLREMAEDELHLNFTALENFSKQAIDLIDRNLFERSADIRWWATDEYFWKALMDPSSINFEKASSRLKVINGSYTMYRNLILADSNGDICACSLTETQDEISKINVSNQIWFQKGMSTNSSSDYGVQDAMKSPLEKNKNTSLIYSGGIRKEGSRSGKSIGVLGILFDWDTEAKNILKTCLPKDRSGKIIDGSVALYTNSRFEIIETTDNKNFPVGMKLNLPSQITSLESGESYSGLFDFLNIHYIFGSSKTKGYREYEGLGWFAHVLRPF